MGDGLLMGTMSKSGGDGVSGFCKTCGWNLVKVPVGTKTKWGVATEERPHYYNHLGCKTGEENA